MQGRDPTTTTIIKFTINIYFEIQEKTCNFNAINLDFLFSKFLVVNELMCIKFVEINSNIIFIINNDWIDLNTFWHITI